MTSSIKKTVDISIENITSSTNSSPLNIEETQDEFISTVNKLSVKLFIRSMADLSANRKDHVITDQYITAVTVKQHGDVSEGKPMKMNDDRYNIFLTEPVTEKDYVSITVHAIDPSSLDKGSKSSS